MFRSTTDEMLAARFDPEPWVTEDGKRQATSEVPYRLGSRTYADFAPRVECIPSRDPYPWRVEVIDRADMDLRAARDGERLSDPAWTTFWDASTERLVFDPRPEYARPEPNPILVALRELANRNGTRVHEYLPSLEPGMAWQWESVGTPEHIEHARKVLTRLANMSKEA